jgi:hypothetical protein
VLNFTVLMGFFMALGSWLLFLFHRQVTESRIVGYLGFLSMMYDGVGFFGKAIGGDPYFQFYPLRFLFPAISVYLAYCYFRSPGLRLYYLNFLLGSIALIWNFESGVVVCVAWIMSLLYMEIGRAGLKAMALHVIKGLGVLLAVFAIFNFLMLMKYGQIPHYRDFFAFHRIYYGAGYMALPMPLVHP